MSALIVLTQSGLAQHVSVRERLGQEQTSIICPGARIAARSRCRFRGGVADTDPDTAGAAMSAKAGDKTMLPSGGSDFASLKSLQQEMML